MNINAEFPTPVRTGTKDVYVVIEHNDAIKAWAAIRAGLDRAPVLISLDYHTDCHHAFVRWVYQDRKFGLMTPPEDLNLALEEECKKIDRCDPHSVEEAAYKLRNDEHIDAAIKAGIIDHGYIINHQDSTGTRSDEELAWDKKMKNILFILRNPKPAGQKTYSMPPNRMFIIPGTCSIGCSRNPHDEVCERVRYDQAIETEYLKEKFEVLSAMAEGADINCIFEEPYILDIDLDYFRTAKSIQPENASLFHQLIRGAVAITVALEPNYVNALRLEGEVIDSDLILEQLKIHIRVATT